MENIIDQFDRELLNKINSDQFINKINIKINNQLYIKLFRQLDTQLDWQTDFPLKNQLHSRLFKFK